MRLVLVQIISVSKDVVLTKAPRIYLIFITIESIAVITSGFNEA